ncbi:MAG: hypothetical protein AAFN79_10460 [Pseudomonadota bacterium]
MRILFSAVAITLLAPAAHAAEDYAAFRACVEAVEEATVTATFHHCTAEIAAPCGASATAKEAAACIDAKRDEMEAEIFAQTFVLAAKTDDAPEEVTSALAGNRSAGEASCAMMAQRDAAADVAVGQRAVNGAFCQLIATGDVLGMAYRLETE